MAAAAETEASLQRRFHYISAKANKKATHTHTHTVVSFYMAIMRQQGSAAEDTQAGRQAADFDFPALAGYFSSSGRLRLPHRFICGGEKPLVKFEH